MQGKLTILIEKDEYGYFAYCPELKGCHSQGDTFEEALSNVKEAVDLYIETLDFKEDNMIFNKEIFSTSYEVSFA